MAADGSLARARKGTRDGEAEPPDNKKRAAPMDGPSSKHVTEAVTHSNPYRLKSYCTIRRK
jgi:hypothetical protein